MSEHSVIYLSPSDDPEREWCQDDVWEESVRYNLGTDFDAQRLRADTAEAYAKAVSKSFDDLAVIVGYSTERLGQTGESPMDCAEQVVAKLAAAEQRIAELYSTPAIDAAAKKLAECMDYPWEHMPGKGRSSMRDHARAIIDAALNPNPEAESHE